MKHVTRARPDDCLRRFPRMQNLGVGYDTVLEETAASQAPNICPSRQVASLQARYDRQVCDLQRRGSVKMKTVVLKVFDSTI